MARHRPLVHNFPPSIYFFSNILADFSADARHAERAGFATFSPLASLTRIAALHSHASGQFPHGREGGGARGAAHHRRLGGQAHGRFFPAIACRRPADAAFSPDTPAALRGERPLRRK